MSLRAEGRVRVRRTPATAGPRAIVAALLAAGMAASFTITLVLPIQAELPVLIGASRDDTAWVVTATLLASAIATPISGRLGDMYGKRRIVLVLIAILVVGSIVAACSTHVIPLILGRAIQGISMGVIPLGIAIMRDTLPPQRLGMAIGLMSATIGIGGALGLPLGGMIAGAFDWHLVFWISALLAAAAFVLVCWRVPPGGLRTPARLDVVGALGMIAGLACLLLAVTRGNEWGWGSPTTLGLLGGGIAILLAWTWWELRVPSPIADLRVSAQPTVLLTNLASAALAFSLYAGNVIYPQLLELPAESGSGVGLSLFAAGLVMVPQALAITATSPLSGRLVTVIGPKALLAISGAMACAGYGITLLAPLSEWTVLASNIVLGSAAGVVFSAMPTLIMRAVPATETGAANGINALMRNLGNSTAAAIVGAILANLVMDFQGSPLPTAEAFRITIWVSFAAGVVAAGIALCIPSARRRASEQASIVVGPTQD